MKFKSKFVGCTESLKAISDKSRFMVLEMLLEKETYVSEIIKNLKIEPTLLSHHLSILRQQGLILSERHGKSVLCKINPKVKIKGKNKGLDLGNCKITLIPGKKKNFRVRRYCLTRLDPHTFRD